MARTVRRWLARHPHTVLAVLLAFGIELVPPPSGIVHHRHAGGGVVHTHAGRIVDASATHAERAAARVLDAVALTSAPARDLHAHTLQPFVSLRGPGRPTAAPTLLISATPADPPLAAGVIASGSAQARGPPVLPA